MKTVEQILKYEFQCLDGRDLYRLFDFLTEEQLNSIGVTLKEEYKGKHKTIPLTREKVLENLERDVAFAFEKALDQRGISASFMYEVVKMWNWILEEGLEDFDDYAQYGLPLFKATALKYGFDNPIGEDTGEESKYASYDD